MGSSQFTRIEVCILSVFKWKGENTNELASLLKEQLNYSKIKLVEDLKEEEEGLVSFALGVSQKLVPVFSFDASLYVVPTRHEYI